MYVMGMYLLTGEQKHTVSICMNKSAKTCLQVHVGCYAKYNNLPLHLRLKKSKLSISIATYEC